MKNFREQAKDSLKRLAIILGLSEKDKIMEKVTFNGVPIIFDESFQGWQTKFLAEDSEGNFWVYDPIAKTRYKISEFEIESEVAK